MSQRDREVIDTLEATPSVIRALRLSPVPGLPDAGDLLAGTYRIVRELGSGSMGTVLLAVDEQLQRRVAIKFIKPTLPVEQLSERFAIEARACARLTHPGVVSVYDFGKVGDCPYLIMEWLDGRGLEAWIAERGRLTATETARLGVNLADTLRAAHAAAAGIGAGQRRVREQCVADGLATVPGQQRQAGPRGRVAQ